MARNTLLLAGGSHADIPIILAAKRAGFQVITSGNRPNDRGHACGDAYVPADYSDCEAVCEVARTYGVSAVIASANDFSALSCAYTAEKLGLPGHDSYETAKILHHKDRFRDLARKLGLRIPKAVRVTKSEAYVMNRLPLTWPVMVKPVDLTGGKGMTKVSSFDNLSAAFDRAFSVSKKEYVVIEEYIEGTNHGYSTFLKNGEIVFGFMDDEHYFLNPFLVSGASTSLHYSQEIARKLNRQLETLAAHLALVDGLLHVQFILKEKEPFIIEICRRTPGDLYVKLVEYATGFSMSDAIVQSAAGKVPEDFSMRKTDWITRHCVMSRRTGTVCGIDYGGLESIIFDKTVFYRENEIIEDIGSYKAEIDFIRYESREQMQEICPRLTDKIQIRMCR